MATTEQRKLIIMSNRLPIAIVRNEEGAPVITQGAGGLVSALSPVLKDRGGLWIGWPGAVGKGLGKPLREFSREVGYILRPVSLDEQDINNFYLGFSNEILWPLFHEFQLPSNYKTSYWDAYHIANTKFAEVAAASSRADDFIWVHDYHLMLQASLLKEMKQERNMGFFLHIPFPPADIFLKLPWRKELIDAMLDFDLLGFQTARDCRNFYDVIKRIYPKATKHGRGAISAVTAGNKKTRLGTFPISIDFRYFARLAAKPETHERSQEIRAAFGNRFLLFGADRLDYTKGVPQRLSALREALRRYPELREQLCMIQVLVPSRQEVPQYHAMKEEIERLVGELNGQFATPGWTPVQYMYRSLDHQELASYYMAADMALVTPLRDGMNLVAKEYAACNVDAHGILCLSEFAGAAMEFHRYALMINPFDIVRTADAIRQAVDMPLETRRRKMRRMRATLRRYDIFHWVDDFLLAAFAKRLADFPTKHEAWKDWEAKQGPPWDEDDARQLT